MKRFEYCTFVPFGYYSGQDGSIKFSNGKSIQTKRTEHNTEDVLNDLGKDGWEMVSCGTENGGEYHSIYLKREII